MSTAAQKVSASPTLARYSAAQRAAVIIALLGEETARPIVEKLDNDALVKVVSALEDISLMPTEELSEIVVDFLGHLRKFSGDLLGGKVNAQELISGIVESRRTVAEVGESVLGGKAESSTTKNDEDSGDVWTRLSKKDPEYVGTYLNRLPANLISLIMRKLNVTVSSEIMNHIDDEKLEPIMAYLVESQTDDPGIDQVISRMVEIEFLNVDQSLSEDDHEHLESLGELLSLIPSAKRDNLVGFLKSHHENKLESIQKSLFTIDGLPDMLPRNAVPIVFREMDASVTVKLLTSLQGANAAVSEFLLGNISSRMADQMRDDVNNQAALSEEEAEIVQRDFLSLLMNMKRSGKIEME